MKIEEEQTFSGYIGAYDLFVEALTDPRLPRPSPAAIGKFCRYLARRLDSKNIRIWVALRILEKFLPLSSCVEAEVKAYLKKQAETYLNAYRSAFVARGRTVRYVSLGDIDPRIWFGWHRNRFSLWGPDRSVPIHPLVQEAIYERIDSIRREHPDTILTMGMFGRAEAELPLNFTLPLVQQIVGQRIFVETRNTVQSDTVDLFYARALCELSDEELLSLLPPASEGTSAAARPDAEEDA